MSWTWTQRLIPPLCATGEYFDNINREVRKAMDAIEQRKSLSPYSSKPIECGELKRSFNLAEISRASVGRVFGVQARLARNEQANFQTSPRLYNASSLFEQLQSKLPTQKIKEEAMATLLAKLSGNTDTCVCASPRPVCGFDSPFDARALCVCLRRCCCRHVSLIC